MINKQKRMKNAITVVTQGKNLGKQSAVKASCGQNEKVHKITF